MTRAIRHLALFCCLCILGLIVGRPPLVRAAQPTGKDDVRTACRKAISVVEAEHRLPAGLLEAVAMSESGRWDVESRSSLPWPWTVTAGGEGLYFDSKADAVAQVERLRQAGRTNIDVGCMQINLFWHPDAFPGLDLAFDPLANVAYGAAYLAALYEETRSWARAIERYHTSDPERGEAYRGRVFTSWDKARGLSKAEPIRIAALPDQPAASGELPPRLINRNAAQAVWRWITPAPLAPYKRLTPALPIVIAGPAPPAARAGIPGLFMFGGGFRRAAEPGSS